MSRPVSFNNKKESYSYCIDTYQRRQLDDALMEYLRRLKPAPCPNEEELHSVSFEFDPAPPLDTLMLDFCGEISLNHWHRWEVECTPSR